MLLFTRWLIFYHFEGFGRVQAGLQVAANENFTRRPYSDGQKRRFSLRNRPRLVKTLPKSEFLVCSIQCAFPWSVSLLSSAKRLITIAFYFRVILWLFIPSNNTAHLALAGGRTTAFRWRNKSGEADQFTGEYDVRWRAWSVGATRSRPRGYRPFTFRPH